MSGSATTTVAGSPLVGAPLLPTMTRLAVPGVLGALIQTLLFTLEAWYLSRAGTTALAAVATVFPLIMLATMLSAGAIGGATSGAIARALGAADLVRAQAILRGAVLIAVVGGMLMGALVILAGPAFFYWLGARDKVLAAAIHYARIVFVGVPLLWLFNMLCSVLRGSGDMVRVALAMAAVVLAYAVFGAWLFPAAGPLLNTHNTMSAAAYTLLLAYGVGVVTVLALILRPAQPIRLRAQAIDWQVVGAVLRPGLLAGTQSTVTILYSLIATGLLGRFGVDWLAGYGLAMRLELVMIPVIFGIGATLIAIVGAHAGAGQRTRAIQIAWRGTLANTIIIGAVGFAFAMNPQWWCGNLGSNPTVIAHCSTTLQTLGPFYGFFAAGLGLYFASQGLNTLAWPVLGAVLRTIIVASGLLWLNSNIISTPQPVLWLIAGAMCVYGIFVALAMWCKVWRT
ncbi:MAG: MATE family efflux transporter [Candidatus Competibacteraceae bacterium]|nr:MATE family efflux transporter [Candidatus Competibacteraceae bacterium]